MTKKSINSLKVLVIEDNDFTRFTIKKHLSAMGMEDIYEAPNGYEGMKLLESRAPDLVVCDIRMEPVNGFDFLEHVRGKGSPWRRMPVIFLTSSSDPSDVKKALDSGIDGYLLKPVAADDLQKKITELIAKL